MAAVSLDWPWIEFDLGAPMQVLSWAVNRPGLVTARHILWREVRNQDLPPDLNVQDWYAGELDNRGRTNAVAFLTSRDLRHYCEAEATAGAAHAHAVATVGLSNAERVGRRADYSRRDWGTINVGLRLSSGLTQTGLIEAMSIAVQARTAAVMDAACDLPTGIATGTGTDCVAVAAPSGGTAYAGLHTDVGEAVGRAVYEAVLQGALDWKSGQRDAVTS